MDRDLAYLLSGTTPDYLQEKLDHIAYVFEKFNNYFKWVIMQSIKVIKVK